MALSGIQAVAKAGTDQPKQSAGKLTAMLILTDKPKIYSRKWSRDKSKFPVGPTVSAIAKSRLVVAMVFFKGCSAGRYRRCDSEVTFQVFKPDGKLYAKRDGLALWRGREVKGVMLSQANLAISFEAKDPVGKYKIKVTIRDNVSNKKLTLVRYLNVKA